MPDIEDQNKKGIQLPDVTINPSQLIEKWNDRKRKGEGVRTIIPLDPSNRKKFSSNSISTSKYGIFSFFPIFFFEQFGKPSNFFFLFTACISIVGPIAIIPPAIAVSPLLIVLSITAIKEILEDLSRHRADRKANSCPVLALRGEAWKVIQWKDVIVGDILKIEEDEPLCADICVLATSSPQSICFIQTASLDGETNLKIRQGPNETNHLATAEELSQLKATFKCEAPNNRLYTFDGTLQIHSIPNRGHSEIITEQKDIAIGPNEIILRGCTLKNTKWVHGIVFFTGHDTKLFRNARAAPIKQSSVQAMLNHQIIFLFLIILSLCIIMLVGGIIQKNAGGNAWYLMFDASQTSLIMEFLSSILLVQNIIPIGLFVQLEIARFVQGWFINSDINMYYEQKDTTAKARTTNLNEDLGRISHIFSDKTGTLTQNKMVFKACSLGGCMYGDVEDTKDTKFDGTTLLQDMKEDPLKSDEIYNFLLTLSVCHTVIPEKKYEDPETQDKPYIQYQASSPDEYALVKTAADLGFAFQSRSQGIVVLLINNEEYEFKILQVNDFNSVRKRMSIVCRTHDDRIVLFCKGADNVIFERLQKTTEEAQFQAIVEEHLLIYSKCGLRTLCIAMKELNEEEYSAWSQIYYEASISLEDRERLLDEAAELIERDLHLLGCTAIEDKLQEGVPETLEIFSKAGIKVWVLTGDKQETAINIGLSSNVIKDDMELMICNGDRDWLMSFLKTNIAEKLENGTPPNKLALVIDGTTLFHALERDLQKSFLSLANLCGAVICCRVSPLQKAKVVQLTKDNSKSITLAIGDGANDVNMIQTAHIGVGIHGEEGAQASRASDYSISQFRYLHRLMFMHGSWSYYRQTHLIFYQFYIQTLFNFITFYYQSVNMFSYQIIYQPLLQTLFYTVFTGMPILFSSIVDKHLSTDIIERFPQVYANNIHHPEFTYKNFWGRFGLALIHTLILFILVYKSFSPIQSSLWVFGSTMYTCVILTLTLVLGFEIYRITPIDFATMTISIILYVICQYVVSNILVSQLFFDYYGIFNVVKETPITWLVLLLVPTTVLMAYLTFLYVKAYHFPNDIQILNEIDFRNPLQVFLGAADVVKTKFDVIRPKKEMNTSFAFSMPEDDHIKQSSLVKIFDETGTQKLESDEVNLKKKKRPSFLASMKMIGSSSQDNMSVSNKSNKSNKSKSSNKSNSKDNKSEAPKNPNDNQDHTRLSTTFKNIFFPRSNSTEETKGKQKLEIQGIEIPPQPESSSRSESPNRVSSTTNRPLSWNRQLEKVEEQSNSQPELVKGSEKSEPSKN